MNRRSFLQTAAAFAIGAHAEADNVSRLACNSWPFRAYFDTPKMHQYRDAKYSLLTQADFPAFLADQFGIHNVEFLPQHFVETDSASLRKVRAGLAEARSRCVNLMGVEFTGGVYDPHADTKRIAAEADQWIGVAVALGAPSLTVALTGKEPPDPLVAAANLLPVIDGANRRGVKVLFHNDDIRRESAETLVAVIEKIGRGRTGTCPDFGNFAPRSALFALDQLRLLAPFAHHICHAKDGIAENGKMYTDDFSASMRVMHNANFQGVYSLEYEGLETPLEGTRHLMEMTLEQLRSLS